MNVGIKDTGTVVVLPNGEVTVEGFTFLYNGDAEAARPHAMRAALDLAIVRIAAVREQLLKGAATITGGQTIEPEPQQQENEA